MRFVTLNALWARKRRVVSSGVAIIIGVAFLTATTLLGNSVSAGLDQLFTEGFSTTSVQVRSSQVVGDDRLRQPIDVDIADTLVSLDQVANVRPFVDGMAQVYGPDGELVGGYGPPTVGTNWLGEPSPWTIVEGRAPSRPDEVVLNTETAAGAGYRVGDVVTLAVPARGEYTMVGTADLKSGHPLGGATYAWFDSATAGELLLGSSSWVSGFDLVATDGVSDEALATAVRPLLPDSVEVATQAQLVDEAIDELNSSFLDFLKAFLLVFAIVALLVAAFSISNTFSIIVAQRTRESALLRALGATRRQVLTSVTLEALVVGAVASAVGFGLGVALSLGLRRLIEASGGAMPVGGLGITTVTVVVVIGVGVAITVLASVTPAWRASRISPLAALRSSEVESSRLSVPRFVGGLLLTIAGGVSLAVSGEADSVALVVFAGAATLFTGVVLLGPAAARLATTVVGTPIRWLSRSNGRLAQGNAERNPRRTASTASALMVGTAVVALFATFGSSIKAEITRLIDEGFAGDLAISDRSQSGPGIDPKMRAEIKLVPGVAAVAPLTFVPIDLDGKPTTAMASDMADLATLAELGKIDGSIADVGVDELAISRATADGEDWDLGTTIEASYLDPSATETGGMVTRRLTVTAIYERDALWGPLLIDLSTVASTAPSAPAATDGSTDGATDGATDSSAVGSALGEHWVFVHYADGVSEAEVRPAIERIAQRYGDPRVENADEYVATQADQVDVLLSLVYVLLGLAVLIAVIGIANTLSLSVYERTRELGLLRAVGQTRRGLRATVRWESVIVAVFGTFGGLGLGTFIAWGAIAAINAASGFGSFALPVTTLVVIAVVALLVGVIAAIRPARRAAKLNILDALATT